MSSSQDDLYHRLDLLALRLAAADDVGWGVEEVSTFLVGAVAGSAFTDLVEDLVIVAHGRLAGVRGDVAALSTRWSVSDLTTVTSWCTARVAALAGM